MENLPSADSPPSQLSQNCCFDGILVTESGKVETTFRQTLDKKKIVSCDKLSDHGLIQSVKKLGLKVWLRSQSLAKAWRVLED